MTLGLGDRIEDEHGSRGTIRYIGPVATSKDAETIYYGVEWDEWGRGLNDGSVVLPATQERIIHFQGPSGRLAKTPSISVPPMTEFKCSFLKQTKYEESLVTNRSTLLERLQERYDPLMIGGDRMKGTSRDIVITGNVGTTLGRHKVIELVGVNKLQTQQTLGTLEKISLAKCQIASLGIANDGELTALSPHITELDLAFNLLSTWNDIFQIIDELPLLNTLILTGNRLLYMEQEMICTYPQIQVLVLNKCCIPWKELVCILQRHFPALIELHVGANEYNDDDLLSIELKDQKNQWLSTLEVLDLNDNEIQHWNTVERTIGRAMPHLKQLVINGNQLSTLVTTFESSTDGIFQELRSLSLDDNLIESWASIDALNAFPTLDTLRFMRNPLTAQMGAGEARMVIIARMEYLQVFNASSVRAKERSDAEQMYLKRILHERAAVVRDASNEEAIVAFHPRYIRLCELYPDLVALSIGTSGARAGSDGGPTTLAASLVQIEIVPMSMNATTFDPLTKKLSLNMKISQLKVFVEKKFGVEVKDQLLTFRMDRKSMPLPLDDDTCDLSYYGLQDGAEILINDA